MRDYSQGLVCASCGTAIRPIFEKEMPAIATCATCRRPLDPPTVDLTGGFAFCSEECLELAAEGYWIETRSDRQTVMHHGPVAFPATGPDKPKIGERMRDFILRYLARSR